jgi:hypothetical protein
MTSRTAPVSAAPRGFQWRLQPAERWFDVELEAAKLALARLQRESDLLEQAERRRAMAQQEQERLALQAAQRDVFAGAHAVRYLASLQVERIAADARRTELQQRLAAARAECVQRQRRLESVQALRATAQQEHMRAGQRRDCLEADAAWLATSQVRRAVQSRAGSDER